MTANDFDDLVLPDRVHTSLYRDPAIFEEEMDRIFNRTWVWVAHDSDIPKPGDFITTHVGRQPVIVNRTKAGEVHVMVNRCRHRGATVCEARKGNAAGFVCPYHAWTYAQDGRLRGIPLPKGYKDFDKADYGLIQLRVEE